MFFIMIPYSSCDTDIHLIDGTTCLPLLQKPERKVPFLRLKMVATHRKTPPLSTSILSSRIMIPPSLRDNRIHLRSPDPIMLNITYPTLPVRWSVRMKRSKEHYQRCIGVDTGRRCIMWVLSRSFRLDRWT